MSWKGESRRHGLARKGIKTAKGVYPKDTLDKRKLNELKSKDKIRVAIISGQEGRLFIENIPINKLEELIHEDDKDSALEFDFALDTYITNEYGSNVNWQVIYPEVYASKDLDVSISKVMGDD